MTLELELHEEPSLTSAGSENRSVLIGIDITRKLSKCEVVNVDRWVPVDAFIMRS